MRTNLIEIADVTRIPDGADAYDAAESLREQAFDLETLLPLESRKGNGNRDAKRRKE